MNSINNSKPDSLIFDMDGTLWDATEVYRTAWNICFRKHNIDTVLSTPDVTSLTGLEISVVLGKIMPGQPKDVCERVVKDVEDMVREFIPLKGGQLYADVFEGLKKLSEHYQLYIISNCADQVIRLFMEWAGISSFITDEIAHGSNYKSKKDNIRILIEKHGLKNPVYIGDTEGDRIQSEAADVPFVFVSYGFGKPTKAAHLEFADFKSFSAHYLGLSAAKPAV